MPALNPDAYVSTYIRCQVELEKTLPALLWPGDAVTSGLDLRAALNRVCDASPDKRAVLFLDQFDRAVARFDITTRVGRSELTAFLNEHLMTAPERLTLVPIIVNDGTLVQTLCQACIARGLPWSIVQCAAFERKDVEHIIQALSKEAGLELDQLIVDHLLEKYDETRSANPDQRFTLAHIQTVCHILAATQTVDYDSYRSAFENNLGTLNQAINVCDIISFVEDFSWSDAVWFRNMIKVPLRESKERIAAFIKTHYEELVPQPTARRLRTPANASPIGV